VVPLPTPALQLQDADEQQLRQWLAAFGTPQQVALRSQIVLAAAEGQSDNAIAQQLEVNRKTVTLWRARFTQEGLDSLWEVAPGRGRKPTYGPEKIQSIVDATLRSKPKGMTQWSCRLMAARQGVSKSTINNIWQSHNLKPPRVKTFKLSRDAKFLEKLTDVVGLYRNPPQQAMVLCVDEKSQIQALDRTQPGLPMKKGRCGSGRPDCRCRRPRRIGGGNSNCGERCAFLPREGSQEAALDSRVHRCTSRPSSTRRRQSRKDRYNYCATGRACLAIACLRLSPDNIDG
jgi:Homeodomain-like domain